MRLDTLAEARIKQAERAGELDNLPGSGRPLGAPPEGPASEAFGFRAMAEAGALPEEIKLRKAVEAQLALLRGIADPAERQAAMARLADLQTRLGLQEEARRKFMASG